MVDESVGKWQSIAIFIPTFEEIGRPETEDAESHISLGSG